MGEGMPCIYYLFIFVFPEKRYAGSDHRNCNQYMYGNGMYPEPEKTNAPTYQKDECYQV